VIATKSTQPPVTLALVELSPTLRKPFQAPRDRGLSFGRLTWAACLRLGRIKNRDQSSRHRGGEVLPKIKLLATQP